MAVNVQTEQNILSDLEKCQPNSLILSHMGFVKAVAKKFKTKFPSADIDDLIQAGNVGLIEAARRFDPKRAQVQGVKFTTYAYPWIRKYIIEECEKVKYVLHVPDKIKRKIVSKNKIQSKFLQFRKRAPTFEESVNYFAMEMQIGKEKARKFVRNIGMAEAQVYSLDRKINEDSNITFADIIPDPNPLQKVERLP